MAKRCDWEIHLRKCKATWHYFTQNPQCGGGGSNVVAPKKIALARAMELVPKGTTVKVITQDCYGRKVLKTESVKK